jgi:hypothetical protein
MRKQQNNHHSLENREEGIRRRRSLASIRSGIFVLWILHSTIIPLVVER